MISPGAKTVCPGPVKSLSIGTVRSPSALAMSTCASATSKPATVSAAGEAWAMFPPIVARLRIWIDPISAAPSASAVWCCWISADNSTARTFVIAPTLMLLSDSVVMPANPGIFCKLITDCGASVSAFIPITRSVPPASSCACSCANRREASARVAGSKNSKFLKFNPPFHVILG